MGPCSAGSCGHQAGVASKVIEAEWRAVIDHLHVSPKNVDIG